MIDLDALEALEKRATPGEWESQGVWVSALKAERMVCKAEYLYANMAQGNADARLIAFARNALPELLRLARIGQKVEATASQPEGVVVPREPLLVVLDFFRKANWPDTKAGNAAYQLNSALAAAKEE